MSDQCQDEIDLTLDDAENNAPEDFSINILTYNKEKETDWFILDKPGNTFSIKPELAPWWNDPFFRELVADRVRFGLTRYFSRKAQVADIIYNDAIFKTGFPIPRDFALAFYAENSLKPGDSRKIKLKINGKRYDALFQRPGPTREYRVIYGPEDNLAHAFGAYLGDRLKPGGTAFTLRASGKNELVLERPR
jgi:hypothetical protein